MSPTDSPVITRLIPTTSDLIFVNNTQNGTDPHSDNLSIDKLYPAIFQCFAIILAGYIAGRAALITDQQGKGISVFVSKFCLPALLFRSMVSLNFSTVNWNFLLGIAISKSAVFFGVMIITLLVKRPVNLGYAGLFAIFATQSNDFAVGYPVWTSKSAVFFGVVIIALLVKRPVNLGYAGLFAIFATQSNDFAVGYPVWTSKSALFFGVMIITLLVKRPINLGYAGLFAIFATQSNDFAVGYPVWTSKSAVFFGVMIITLLVKRPVNLGYAGLFAIFATQSNDFAVGYPVWTSKSAVFFGLMIMTFLVKRPVNLGYAGLFAIFATQSNDFAVGYPVWTSKSAVFFCVMIITLLVKRPINLGYAGLFAIFATQSNDFAVGYPVWTSKSAVFFGVMIITLLVKRPVNLGYAGLFAIFATQSNDFAVGYPVWTSKSAVFFGVMIMTLLVKRPINLGYAGLFAIFATQSNDFAVGYPVWPSKSAVFFGVMIITLLVKRPVNLGYAGLFAIFATQSNDFAVGYPVWTSKSAVFFGVMIITLLVKRPVNLGYAGLFAIFATQSNNFAVGYPVLRALYGDSNPEYLQYIYLVAPISLVMLNPIGFTLLEIDRQREESLASKRKTRTCVLVLKVIKEVLTNPIVFMVIIGIAGNFVFKQKMPRIIDDVLEVLGNAFSASALFYLGLSLVGKVRGQLGIGLVVPLLLIGAKTLLLPLITWQVVGALEPHSPNSTHSLSMYGFLYGTFPTAPSVFIYASQFAVAQDIIATGMVVCTFLSAPLMFVSAKMMTVVVYSEMDYKSLLLSTSFDLSVISLFLNVWILAVLFFSKKHKKIPHQFLIVFVLTQTMAAIGMIVYDGLDTKLVWHHYLQFVTALVGVFSTRCITAVLSIVLYLIHCRSLCMVLRVRVWLYLFGIGVPILGTGGLLLFGTHHMHDEIDPSFHYGIDQAILSLIILSLCTIINITFLVLRQRYTRSSKERTSSDVQARLHRNKYSSSTIQEVDEDEPLLSDSAIAADGGEQISHTSSSADLLHEAQDNGAETTGIQKYKNCRDCPANCDTSLDAGAPLTTSIEDIVPFPTDEQRGLNRSLNRSESSSSAESFTDTIQEQSCRAGTCTYQQRQKCAGLLRCYHSLDRQIQATDDVEVQIKVPRVKDDYQTERFIVLLLVLQLSMFMGIFLCTWRLFNKKTTGIYVEIEFLDSVFTYGQSLVVFAIFGFDTRLMIIPCIKRWRKCIYGTETVHIPRKSDLTEETTHTCDQFIKYHKDNCSHDIVRDRKYRFRTYSKVFCGTSLCDWLIEVGLARDRQEAVSYGRTLLIGQVICHVTKEHDFHDMPYFYKFVEEELDSE